MQRFFTTQDGNDFLNKKLLLPDDIFHHAIKVLRMKQGDQFELVTHDEQVYLCELTTVTQHESYFEIQNKIERSTEMPSKVTIVCGVSKGDKAEEIVKKGTQLGADQFIFLNSRYSVARWKAQKQEKKISRLQTIALNAAEQSHRNHIPEVRWVDSINQLVQLSKRYDYRVIAYEEAAKKDEKTVMAKLAQNLKNNPNSSVIAFFGPEGGIASEEIELLTTHQFECAGLGPRILRAETAPLYFLAALSFVTELE